jgi:uncharacterized membrane protein YqhA
LGNLSSLTTLHFGEWNSLTTILEGLGNEQNFVHQIRQLEADVRERLSLKNRVEQLKVKCQAVILGRQ